MNHELLNRHQREMQFAGPSHQKQMNLLNYVQPRDENFVRFPLLRGLNRDKLWQTWNLLIVVGTLTCKQKVVKLHR